MTIPAHFNVTRQREQELRLPCNGQDFGEEEEATTNTSTTLYESYSPKNGRDPPLAQRGSKNILVETLNDAANPVVDHISIRDV